MHQFQKIVRLFSSTNQPAQTRHLHEAKTMNISAITDDKTKIEAKLHQSYLFSQIQTDQDRSHQNMVLQEASLNRPLPVKQQNKAPANKTKFDLNRLAGSNSYKQSIFKETPRGSCAENGDQLEKSTPYPKTHKPVSRNPFNFTQNLHKNQVKSIIFDSKADKIDGFRSKSIQSMIKANSNLTQKYLNIFKEKVTHVNIEIEASINNLEKMIEDIRAIDRQKKQKKKDKVLYESQLYEVANKVNHQEVRKKSEQQVNEIKLSPSKSKMELKGSFQSKQAAISEEYTTFINRLSNQIQLDMEFTNKASELARNNHLVSIKSIIINGLEGQSANINELFFQIDSAEIDPLQKKSSSLIGMTPEQKNKQAINLLSKYRETQNHFQGKLQHAFSPSIISLLFEELSAKAFEAQKESITVGDLLSYLNMRTNNSFRNRFFVKMMKRLGLKANGCLTATVLQIFTTDEAKA